MASGSAITLGNSGAKNVRTRMLSRRPLNMASVLSTMELILADCGRAVGNRANVENSSTRVRTVSTAPAMVSAQLWSTCKEAASGGVPRSRWRRMRSAESAIGVSGFLISWATRRATSRQAACFCAFSNSERSSNTRTYPNPCPSCFRVATVTATFTVARCTTISICVVVVPMRSARRSRGSRSSRTSGAKTSRNGAPISTLGRP